jgi:hypothetical protein
VPTGVVVHTADHDGIRLLDFYGKVVAERKLEHHSCLFGLALAGGSTLVLTCMVEEGNELREFSLPSLDPGPVIKDRGLSLVGGSSHSLVVQDGAHQDPPDGFATAHLRVLERSTGRLQARVEVWDQSAVAVFEDGKVELFGPHASDALACVDHATVVAFERCRATAEVKDRLAALLK